MLILLIKTLPFFLLLPISKLCPLKPLPSWVSEMALLSLLLFKESFCSFVHCLKSTTVSIATTLATVPSRMCAKKKVVPRPENAEDSDAMSVLDLPDLVVESILGRLPPAGLCNMAAVCSSMRDWCRSDHLWERHMGEKWGRIIGKKAFIEWQSYVALRMDSCGGAANGGKAKGWVGALPCVWPISWLRSKFDSGRGRTSSLPVDSIMSWYLALESGKFWFPAQVYNRENGQAGFMLSCYDAELSYDSCTDTFHARYPPHGRRTRVIEDGVTWSRIRSPPVDTPPHDLHILDCLNDLQPRDHIEIQWRRNKEFPYGWWYGVVGHLEPCNGNELHCCCHKSDTVVLEFNHYADGSRWRRTFINRKDHREEGNETDGFYGGIRKLHSKDEISTWRQLWPTEILE